MKIATNESGDKEKIGIKLNEAVTMTYSLRCALADCGERCVQIQY